MTQSLALRGSTQNSEKLNQAGFNFSPGVIIPVYLQFNGLGCVPIQTFRFTDHINFVDKFTNDFQSIPRQVLFFCRFVKVGGGGGAGLSQS